MNGTKIEAESAAEAAQPICNTRIQQSLHIGPDAAHEDIHGKGDPHGTFTVPTRGTLQHLCN
jgi:hypothetical protein